MAITQTLIENAYSAYAGYIAYPHVLSDGSLAIAVRKPNGGNWDLEIYWSADAGATCSNKLTILSATTYPSYYTTWVGDKCYIGFGPEVNNTALLFYRVDYAAQAFSLAVNGTTVKAAVSGEWYGTSSFDIEPGGRLWCGFCHQAGGWVYARAYYSDDGGASWYSTTCGDSDALQAQKLFFIHCLLYNTVLVFPGTSGGSAGAYYRAHKHTDSTATWTAKTSIFQITGSSPGVVNSAKVAESPAQHIAGTVINIGATPNTVKGWWIAEDGSGTLTVSATSDTVSVPSTESVWPQVSGRSDGAIVYYAFSGSVATMRRRALALSGAWGSESTWTSSPALYHYAWQATARGIAVTAATAEHFVVITTGSNPYYPYVLREGLPTMTLPAVGIVNDLAIEALGTLALISTQPVESLGTLAAVADLHIEWEGLWLAIADALTVLVPLDQSFLDSLTVVAAATLADLIDSLTVRSAIGGGGFLDSLRVLPAGLVALHGDDVQQPYALVTRD